MTDIDNEKDNADRAPRRGIRDRRTLALAAVGLLMAGGTAGAVAMQATRPSVSMAPSAPVAIRSLGTRGIVTVKGRVAEIYGNKFIVMDGSGRALVDTGREGEDEALVTPNEIVTVQGRFDRGFIHAAFVVSPDGKIAALGPLGGPPHGPPHGRRDDRGPMDGPDASPPAPPSARPAVAAPGQAIPAAR